MKKKIRTALLGGTIKFDTVMMRLTEADFQTNAVKGRTAALRTNNEDTQSDIHESILGL